MLKFISKKNKYNYFVKVKINEELSHDQHLYHRISIHNMI